MKSTLLQNVSAAPAMSFDAACADLLSGLGRRGAKVPLPASRIDTAAPATDASGLRPQTKLPRPQLTIQWRRRYDEFWLAPLITGALFAWVRIALAVCGVSPLL